MPPSTDEEERERELNEAAVRRYCEEYRRQLDRRLRAESLHALDHEAAPDTKPRPSGVVLH